MSTKTKEFRGDRTYPHRVITNPEVLQMLAGAGPDWGTRALFSIEHCQIGLLESESTSPGSAVAYLMQMDFSFPG